MGNSTVWHCIFLYSFQHRKAYHFPIKYDDSTPFKDPAVMRRSPLKFFMLSFSLLTVYLQHMWLVSVAVLPMWREFLSIHKNVVCLDVFVWLIKLMKINWAMWNKTLFLWLELIRKGLCTNIWYLGMWKIEGRKRRKVSAYWKATAQVAKNKSEQNKKCLHLFYSSRHKRLIVYIKQQMLISILKFRNSI